MPISIEHMVGIVAEALSFDVERTWRPWEATVLLDVRLPRVLVAALVGGSLALCGAALQGLFKNPLADSSVLGVSAGASLGAVLALYLGLAAQTVWALPLLAFVGAALTAFAVYAIASRRGHTPVGTLLLSGVALGGFNAAMTSFVLSIALANYDIGRQIIGWLMGGLDGRTWDHVKLALPAMLLGTVVILTHARDLDALLLGETHAGAVGVNIVRVRRSIILCTSLLTGAAVAVSGAIGFVGLVVPHVLRLVIGPGHRWLLPTSIVTGAAFLVLTDMAARTLIRPEEIRLGVLTSAIGAPFFIFLLLKSRKEGVL